MHPTPRLSKLAALLAAVAIVFAAATTSATGTTPAEPALPNPDPGVQYLAFNGNGPAGADVDVRRAVALALDRAKLASFSKRDAHARPWSSLIPEGMPGAKVVARATNAYLPPTGAPQLDAARRALTAAAWTPGNSLEFLTVRNASAQHHAAALTSELAAVGITLHVHFVAESKFFPMLQSNKVRFYDVVAVGWVADNLNLANFFQLGTCGKSFGICDRGYDRLYRSLLRAKTARARTKIGVALEAKLTGPNGNFAFVPYLEELYRS